MGDQYRKMEQYSPKSSPRGSRSPIVSRQDTTGTLKTTISLGKNPSIVHSGPFYLMKEPPSENIFYFSGSDKVWALKSTLLIVMTHCDTVTWGEYCDKFSI